ncbi:hypothetical protein ACH5RR_018579 [Cinchona calisaya]|uniref:Reverse transcriptase n=1 Tax=Cinchona calisaya TaxID=153742 RepID=A0ABD2ZLV9_9GENT
MKGKEKVNARNNTARVDPVYQPDKSNYTQHVIDSIMEHKFSIPCSSNPMNSETYHQKGMNPSANFGSTKQHFQGGQFEIVLVSSQSRQREYSSRSRAGKLRKFVTTFLSQTQKSLKLMVSRVASRSYGMKMRLSSKWWTGLIKVSKQLFRNIATCFPMPCLLVGDFNNVLNSSEKFEGNAIDNRKAYENNTWHPINLQWGPLVSHCLFADDIILFAKNSNISISFVKAIFLDDFTKVSSLTINLDKSRMLFPKNTSNHVRSTICNFLNIYEANDLGKYLGFPLKNSKFSTSNVRFILDKVKAKLADWKSRMISFDGRKTIVLQVTSTISSYYMQCCA